MGLGGHYQFTKKAPDKVPLPVKHTTRSGPPEGPASRTCVDHGVQEDEHTNNMGPGHPTSHLAHLEDEIRAKFARISNEFRTTFAGHWQTDTDKATNNTTYACNEVPTPTHISLYLPPRQVHTMRTAKTRTEQEKR